MSDPLDDVSVISATAAVTVQQTQQQVRRTIFMLQTLIENDLGNIQKIAVRIIFLYTEII